MYLLWNANMPISHCITIHTNVTMLTTHGGNIPGTVWTSCAIGRMLYRYAGLIMYGPPL